MNNWNKLLAILDQTLGFPNRKTSKVTKRGQTFDNKTQEHVVWLEYRAKINYSEPPTPNREQVAAMQQRKMALLRDLLANYPDNGVENPSPDF